LHADARCAANVRQRREQRCRFVMRAKVSNESLGSNRAGRVVLRSRTARRGVTVWQLAACRSAVLDRFCWKLCSWGRDRQSQSHVATERSPPARAV